MKNTKILKNTRQKGKKRKIRKILFPIILLSFLILTSIVFVGCGTATKQVLDKEPSTPVVVTPPSAQLVSIEATGYKTTYYAGEEFSTENIIVNGTYDNNGTEEILDITPYAKYSGYSSVPGTYTIKVTIQDQSEDIFTTFNVEVLDVVLDSVMVKTPPTKTAYFVGETLNIEGLIVEGTYNNGDQKNVAVILADCDPQTLNNEGSQIITVEVGSNTATFNVNVAAIALQSIAITTPPTKTSYYVGESLVTTGMVVTAYYNNGTNAVATNYSMSGFDSGTAGTKTITVTVAGISGTFIVNVQELPYVFELTVQVTAGDPTFRLPIHDNTINDLYIDWGDGTPVQHYTSTPSAGQGILKTYARAKDYIIKLRGHTYFTGPYNYEDGGALGFGFGPEFDFNDRPWHYGVETNRQKPIGISGNVSALLGSHKPANNAFIGSHTFMNCINLAGSIPAELFSEIKGAPAEGIFLGTFWGCIGLTGSIPANLFSGISGTPAAEMFGGTFYYCNSLTSIPAGLFSGISGAPAEGMFDTTFSECSGLTSIPAGLFSGISGAPAKSMFYYTFDGCSGLTDNIPAGLFSSISGAPAVGMFGHTFSRCSGLTGQSATVTNGQKLYEVFPTAGNLHVGNCYTDATGILTADPGIPAAWK